MAQLPLAEQVSSADYEPSATQRRRILLAVHSSKLGGAERMALLEAEALEARFEVLLAVPDGPLRSRFAEHGEIVVGATATLPLWGDSTRRWVGSSAHTLLDAVTIARLIRRREIELVLTNSSVCLAPVLAARLAGVPVIVHARDVPNSRLAPLVLALHAKLAQTVIVISDGLTPYFRGGRRTRVVRIPDGIAVPAVPESRPRGAFGSPPRLCLVGGIDPRKGQDIAIAALAQLRERGVEAKLELVGRELDESFAAALRESARQLGVAGDVELVGEVADISPHLDRADIVLAPSRGEWTPLVLMEALARGKPVVAARVGGVAEVVHDRESGLLVAPESPTELANAIVELLADPAAATAMAARGHGRMAAGFRVERTLEGLQTEIDRLLRRESAKPRREPETLQPVL
jgi:glycosyltransferase involved in cell wall biosynthesis